MLLRVSHKLLSQSNTILNLFFLLLRWQKALVGNDLFIQAYYYFYFLFQMFFDIHWRVSIKILLCISPLVFVFLLLLFLKFKKLLFFTIIPFLCIQYCYKNNNNRKKSNQYYFPSCIFRGVKYIFHLFHLSVHLWGDLKLKSYKVKG